MRPRRVALCLSALLPLAAPPARAGEQPATTPTRDVDIAYRLAGADGAAPPEQRVRWDVAGGRQRIDPPMPGLHIIVDTRAHRLASVRDKERLALEIDQSQARPAPGAEAGYTRLGTASIAGIGCTVWREGAAEGGPELCFTADGVLLRVVSAGKVVAEATRVSYGPADPADFDIPADYRRILAKPPPPAGIATTAPKETAP